MSITDNLQRLITDLGTHGHRIIFVQAHTSLEEHIPHSVPGLHPHFDYRIRVQFDSNPIPAEQNGGTKLELKSGEMAIMALQDGYTRKYVFALIDEGKAE